MFHGPLFQGLEKVDSLGLDGIAGELRSTPLSECLKESAQDKWIIDPLLVDSAMQLAGVWARHYMDITVLPTGFKSLHILASPQGEKFKAIVWIPEESKNGQLLCDMGLYDEEGKLVLLMQGLGGVGSKSFNRLAQQPKSFRVKP